jgi:hypothetical protein
MIYDPAARYVSCAVLCIALATGCGSSTAPNPDAKWNYIWQAVSVDGRAIPTTITFAGTSYSLTEEHLLLIGDGAKRNGTWNRTAGAYGGTAFVSWFPHGDSVTVFADSPAGRVKPIQEFALQADGSLVKVEDGFTFRYLRQ